MPAAASEIDDIFAAKGSKRTSGAEKDTAPAAPEPSSSKKKKKDKKRKREPDSPPHARSPSPPPQAKRRVPETVIDPSIAKTAPSKPQKIARKHDTKKPKHKDDKQDEYRFKDSRGTGPRRKTEEGFAIYKEDELGITETGGDTPLCPFDCQCCF